MKLKFADTATRNDLIGVIDQPIMSKFSTLSLTKAFSRQTTQLKQKETVFTLGNRKTVIESELEAPVIVPHAERIQEQSHRFGWILVSPRQITIFSFESLFRSLHYALLDCACREYLFILDFFLPSEQARFQMFNLVFQNILQTITAHLESYLEECWDSIAIFLCIHIILR